MFFLPTVNDKGKICLENKENVNDFLKYIDYDRFAYGFDENTQTKKWVNEGQNKVLKYLNKIKKLSNEQKFELIIVYYPSAIEVLKKIDFKKSLHYKLLKNWSDITNTLFIDTSLNFDTLNTGLKNYKQYFIVCDVHWSKNGHKIIAKNLSMFLNEKNN